MTTGFNGLLVNHAALEQAQEDIRRAVQAIDDRMNRLESELLPLRSDWNGQAKDAYRIAKNKWDTAIGETRLLLNDTGTTVGRSNTDYINTDNAAAMNFQQI